MSSISTSQVVVGPNGLKRQRRFYTLDLPSGSRLTKLYADGTYTPVISVRLYGCNKLSDEHPVLRIIELPSTPPSEGVPGWPISFDACTRAAGGSPETRQSAEITILPTGTTVVKICD